MQRSSSDVTVTDMFCGAGGSSTGLVQAGARVRLAMNHWERAIETHNRNHPNTDHVLADVSQADPRRYPSPTILVASTECTNMGLAQGRERKHQAQLGLWEQKTCDFQRYLRIRKIADPLCVNFEIPWLFRTLKRHAPEAHHCAGKGVYSQRQVSRAKTSTSIL